MNITAPTARKAAVVPAHPVAADNDNDNSTGEDDKERDLPSLDISPTTFSKGDRIRTKATNFDDDAEEDGEPFSVTHAAQGNGMWVNGTIKYVFTNKGPHGKEQTYKALFDGDKVLTKTWHSHIEAEPKEADSSSSSDSDDRRTSTRTMIAKSKPPNSPQKKTNKSGANKDKPKKSAAPKKTPKFL